MRSIKIRIIPYGAGRELYLAKQADEQQGALCIAPGQVGAVMQLAQCMLQCSGEEGALVDVYCWQKNDISKRQPA